MMLHGSITVVDPEGIEYSGEDGRMSLASARATGVFFSKVVIENGLWSCEVPTDARISVYAIELGGRMAFSDLDQMNAVPVPASRFLAVEARWPLPTVLVVKAEDTGLELDEVQVVGDLPLLEGSEHHPGRFLAEHVLTASGSSPIELS